MSHYAVYILNLIFPYVCVTVPLAMFLFVVLLPLVRAMIADKRIDRHQCLNCGYILRKLPPGTTTCPECGRNLGGPPY